MLPKPGVMLNILHEVKLWMPVPILSGNIFLRSFFIDIGFVPKGRLH